MTLLVEFIDGHPICVRFEKAVEARIVSTCAPDHYQAKYKRATIENGVEIKVPLFVEYGDTVLVDLDLLSALRPRKPGDR
jgi:hypothetical protein